MVKDYERIIQTSRYLSYKHSKKHIFSKSQYIFYKQFQNMGTKRNIEHKKNGNLQTHLLQAIASAILHFFISKFYYQFSIKKVSGCLAWKKSRALGDGNTKFLQTLHRPTPFSCAAFAQCTFSRRCCPAF